MERVPASIIGKLFIKSVYWKQIAKPEIDYYDFTWDRSARTGPEFQSDFISVHYSEVSKVFTFCSPLFLVDLKTGTRPSWERLKFSTRKDAVLVAIELAKILKTFVVDTTIGDAYGYGQITSHQFKLGKEGM